MSTYKVGIQLIESLISTTVHVLILIDFWILTNNNVTRYAYCTVNITETLMQRKNNNNMTVIWSVDLQMSILQLHVQSRHMPYTHSVVLYQYLCNSLRQHPMLFCVAH